jgi:hypothetical protein
VAKAYIDVHCRYFKPIRNQYFEDKKQEPDSVHSAAGGNPKSESPIGAKPAEQGTPGEKAPSSRSTKRPSDSANRSLDASARAWIAPDIAYFTSEIAKDVPLSFVVQYRNTGKSPAFDVHSIYKLEQVPVPKFDDNTFNALMEAPTFARISNQPRELMLFIPTCQTHPISSSPLMFPIGSAMMLSKGAAPSCWGCVSLTKRCRRHIARRFVSFIEQA